MKHAAGYGDVALGVECALPAAFAQKHETARLLRAGTLLISAALRLVRCRKARVAPGAQLR